MLLPVRGADLQPLIRCVPVRGLEGARLASTVNLHQGDLVLELVCYLLALIFGLLAVLAPALPPNFDRVRLLAAGFVCFIVPLLVHAAKAV